MSYITDANTAQVDYELHNRIAIAMAKAALAIQAEENSTPEHAGRSTFCLKVLEDPIGYAKKYAHAVCADGAITHASTDGDIDTRISSIWNALCIQGTNAA